MRSPSNGLLSRNDISSLNSRLSVLSKSIKQLSLTESADSSFESKEFKKKQLESLLLGNSLGFVSNDSDMEEINTLRTSFLKMSDSEIYTHLGIVNLKKIGCDFEGLSEDSEVSVLDVHTENVPYCTACAVSSSRKPNFARGIINPFSCWRRGHSSGKFGFASYYELNIANGDTFLTHKGTKTTEEIKSIASGKDNNNSQFEVGSKIIGSNMLVLIKINSNRNVESSKLSEIKGILNQQMLVSTNISKVIMESEERKKRDHRDKIPEYVASTLQEIHNKWHLGGPSNNSKGIIGIALVNNQNKYAESGVFQNVLQSFSVKNNVWYEQYELEQVSKMIKQEIGITNLSIPNNCSLVCIILDPIVDIGGGGYIG